jgi:hypothetical protein
MEDDCHTIDLLEHQIVLKLFASAKISDVVGSSACSAE